MLKLNLGSGKYPLEGYKNIDIDESVNPDECYDLKQEIREQPDSVDEILISHFLMYLDNTQASLLLNYSNHVLKEGGVIRITEDEATIKIRNKKQQEQYGDGKLMTKHYLEFLLRQNGFVQIKESEPFKETQQHLGLHENYPLASGRSGVYFLVAKKRVVKKVPTVYLGLDDFSEKNNQLDILWKLRDYFDDFKINVFASGNFNLNNAWLNYLDDLDWLQLCLHGFNHVKDEDIDHIALDRLRWLFAPVYKAPFWNVVGKMKTRLQKLGYKIITFEMMNWEIDKPLPHDKQIIHAYGHIYPPDYLSENGNKGSSLFWNYKNIMKLPKETEFKLYG